MQNRDPSDLVKCDRCILRILHSLGMQEMGQGLGCSQIQQLLTLFRDILNQKALVRLTVNGEVELITRQAEQLLSKYFDCQESNILPACLNRWFKQQISQLSFNEDVLCSERPLHIDQSEQQLLIYWILDPLEKHYFLLLEEKQISVFSIASLELLELTKRESEILFWIAQDKSNATIAKVLNCREGTVRKHLEHIYRKLGVQTRTGAVMVALEKLGLLKD